jgi:hypothetical protein
VVSGIDYGIVSLLVIQIAAVAACVVAYLRINSQIERVRDSRGDNRQDLINLDLKIETMEKKTGELSARYAEAGKILDELTAGVNSHNLAIGAIETDLRSVKASASASKRWGNREVTPPAPGVPVEQQDLVRTSNGQNNGMPSSFGQVP